MESHTPLKWTNCTIKLHSECTVNLHLPIVIGPSYTELKCTFRLD